jgi:hypothetical protein
MHKKLLLIAVVALLPGYATAAKLNLKQDLGGLDLTVAMEPPGDPSAIRITNKSTKLVACSLSYGPAGPGAESTVTVRPGKSDTLRLVVDASDAPRSADLKCAEKQAAKK